jgi:hypothetical protein
LVLIDELDRCRPDYAISYLETIKHVFDIHGIIFVLAVDRKQLECTAKTTFGTQLDFPEYYRKFVQREVTLPEPSEKNYNALVSKYVQHYLQRETERHCFMLIDEGRVDDIVELISSMKMTPRQVQDVFRIMGHVFETDESRKGKLLWCLGVGTILMSALRIGNPDAYHALGRSNLGIKTAGTFFKTLGLKDPEWWFTLCFTGGGLNPLETVNKELADIYREADFASANEAPPTRSGLARWTTGWGHSTERFKQIYSKIEQVSSWS